MNNKELFEWELRSEREYNNILTGDLKKEKEAYLKGVQDAFQVFSNELGEKKVEFEQEIDLLRIRINELEEQIDDLTYEN